MYVQMKDCKATDEFIKQLQNAALKPVITRAENSVFVRANLSLHMLAANVDCRTDVLAIYKGIDCLIETSLSAVDVIYDLK